MWIVISEQSHTIPRLLSEQPYTMLRAALRALREQLWEQSESNSESALRTAPGYSLIYSVCGGGPFLRGYVSSIALSNSARTCRCQLFFLNCSRLYGPIFFGQLVYVLIRDCL